MSTTRPTRRASAAVALLAAGLLLLAACGSDDTDDSSGGTTATTEAASGTTVTTAGGGNAETVKFDKLVQQQLKDVGCYTGNVDGILGPQTDAAIVAFQTAEGLAVDGEVGPETESALAQATAQKKTVCSGSTPSSTTTSTTASANDPVCSATALAKALPSGTTITQFVCADVYAGVQGQNDFYAVLEWGTQDGQGPAWREITACGTASAGIPPQVLETGCKPGS
jgi:peptidoglycan hydrolase-like protein with peptidoglycan-binding domain